jgi:hypothetical protein
MKHARLHTVVAMALLVTSFLVHPTFAAEPLKSLSALTVVDAHGTKVGSVISLLLLNPALGNVTALVAFAVGQQPLVLLVGPRGFVSTGGPFFNSKNCSGPPLVSSGVVLNSIVEPPAIGVPGHTVYLSEPGAMAQDFATFDGTQLALDGTCQPVHFDSNISLLPARAVVDLDTLFTPPFSVR